MRERIVFMGTPEFGEPSLRALVTAGYDIVGVCCQPDRPQGRGKKLCCPPVKDVATELDIPVFQFPRLRAQEGLDAMRAIEPDYFVTAAFGQILSQKLLDIPKNGTVNVHASLLPKYRGPAPINWCLIEGETKTGVTTMMTDAGVDTGDMLLQRETEILPGERAGDLSIRLSHLGAELLIETLERLHNGTCPRIPQDEAQATRHPMLDKNLGRIDWHLSAQSIVNRMRGLDPWPGIFTTFEDDLVLKIWDAKTIPQNSSALPGTVLVADPKRGMQIATGGGILEILTLQAPGTKRLDTAAFLRGRPLAEGIRLGMEDING